VRVAALYDIHGNVPELEQVLLRESLLEPVDPEYVTKLFEQQASPDQSD
jgi:hypothetical protein